MIARVSSRVCHVVFRLVAALSLVAMLTTPRMVPEAVAQAADLLDRLAMVQGMLVRNPPPPEACTAVGDIETRLYGEPGLVELQPAWTQLAEAAHALQAACGQSALLAQPTTGSAVLQTARADWQAGMRRDLGLACDHLRAAANTLGHTPPC